MRINNVVLVAFVGILMLSCSVFKQNSANGNSKHDSLNKEDSAIKASTDSIRKNKPKPYKDVIPATATTNTGLFTVHRVDERIFFEISDSLLEKEILIVSRVARAAADHRPNQMWGYAGDQIGEKVITFSKGPADKMFIRVVSYIERSKDSSENGMFRTVHNSNLQPIAASFDIKAYSPDSVGSVIDVTDFLNSDNQLLYFDPYMKSVYQLASFQKDKSYLTDIKSFPINVEIRSVNSYISGRETVTYELNNSFVSLPKEAMRPRYHDKRVGYFARYYLDYDVPQRVDLTLMITRWRMEPKDEDKEKYLRGELVEPKKPIIYYIDPATPKKWVPYFIQGVKDWQKAFEKAGFKNAIYALEAPVNDPQWNLYDARHNAFIYKASTFANATGPQIHDPRTGEILESHINWYSNVTQLLHDWYMILASPNDTRARKMVFDDSLMGRLIRYVACHEVGHTLGLMHNFGASSVVSVDSLRSKNYVEKNGFCPSIMDYARFNYVAQPEDSIDENGILPRIGVYDEWAIQWGYRWFPSFESKDKEAIFMNHWIINSLKNDKRLWYGAQVSFGVSDPRAQFEDLGDNSIKASDYAIQNLKRVNDNLIKWTEEPNKGYESLDRMQQNIFTWYQLYLFHVSNNIGLFMTTPTTAEQKGVVISFVPKERQRAAVNFLHRQLFETPTWLINNEIYLRTSRLAHFDLLEFQDKVINFMVGFTRYLLMTYPQISDPQNAYSFNEFLTDLESGIFVELVENKKIDFCRRNLQKVYVERLIKESGIFSSTNVSEEDIKVWQLRTDYVTIFQRHIRKLLKSIDKALPGCTDTETKEHLTLLHRRLKHTLTADIQQSTVSQNIAKRPNGLQDYLSLWLQFTDEKQKYLPRFLNCWKEYRPFDETIFEEINKR